MAVNQRFSILLVDDDEAVCAYLVNLLSTKYELAQVHNSAELGDILSARSFDVVLLDLLLDEGLQGLELLNFVKEQVPDSDVVIISGVRMVQTVVNAIQAGASDFVHKPFTPEELFLTLDRVLEKRILRKQNQLLEQTSLDAQRAFGERIIGASSAIQKVKATIRRLKNQEANTFLMGETGTGKEMFARELHKQEEKKNRPFVSVNCAAIPENLLESVLFGHEKGAFTGASERRIGKFELADGGDIFLDEVNSLGLELQAKLLRVLEEREVERIGSPHPKKVTFRVISAANEDIYKLIEQKLFRADLFYRLNTVSIRLPTLNERTEDIIPLAENFLMKLKKGAHPKILSNSAKRALTEHHWKGNIRELRNTIENILIFCDKNVVEAEDIPFIFSKNDKPAHVESAVTPPAYAQTKHSAFNMLTYKDALREFEREFILQCLERNRWSKTKTCQHLEITRTMLYRKIKDLKMDL